MLLESIALQMTRGIGIAGAAHLLDVFGDACAVFAASAEELVERAALRPDLAAALVARSSFADAERELARCRREQIRVIPASDPAYPPLLREIRDYPAVLYVMGDVSALQRPAVALVGTRSITPYGSEQCRCMVKGLAERRPDLVLVSDLAEGIPLSVHRAAMQYGMTSVAVLASVLPKVTPAAHTDMARRIAERGGAVVSELHARVTQPKYYYVARNRLIAALASGCIVIEAPKGSGSLKTAEFADGYHRAVMALSGRPTDPSMEGANELLRSRRAQLVCTAEDVLDELQWDFEGAAVVARKASEPTPDLFSAPESAPASVPAPAPAARPTAPSAVPATYREEAADLLLAADVGVPPAPAAPIMPVAPAAVPPAGQAAEPDRSAEEEQLVLACFTGSDLYTLNELRERTGLPMPRLLALLELLEFDRQQIRRFHGYTYLKRCD